MTRSPPGWKIPAVRSLCLRAVCGILTGCAMYVTPAPSWADQLRMGEANYPGAKIIGLEQGRLQFRTASGKLAHAWLNDVDLIIVDRGGPFADFNEAEQYLTAGQGSSAVVRYRRARRRCTGFWSELVEIRLFQAYAAAGPIDQAALSFVRVVRGKWSGPAAAVRLIPTAVPGTALPGVPRAIQTLEAALRKNPTPSQRVPLELFRYELFRLSGNRRATEAQDQIATLIVPEFARCDRVFAIQLAALTQALQDGPTTEELVGLDGLIERCPEAMLPGALLLKGEVLLRTAQSREELIRAGWPFLRVAVHMPNDPRAAEGLFGAARALERLGRIDKAAELIAECLAHKKLTEETRKRAQAALERLQSERLRSGSTSTP